jgi:hypothetical protein
MPFFVLILRLTYSCMHDSNCRAVESVMCNTTQQHFCVSAHAYFAGNRLETKITLLHMSTNSEHKGAAARVQWVKRRNHPGDIRVVRRQVTGLHCTPNATSEKHMVKRTI